MKKKNGFTLIELLAIIVILAIIAVITVPIILDIIDNSKKGAATDSFYGYKDSIGKYYVAKLYEDPNYTLNGTFTVDELETLGVQLNGEKPEDGWVKIERGNVVDYSLKFDEYTINFDLTTNKPITTKNGEITTSPSEWFTYSEADANGHVSITGFNTEEYDGSVTDIIFPIKDVNGNLVTEIGQDAFSHNLEITSVIIPNGIQTIKSGAFSQTNGSASQLKKVAISNSVITIEQAAFISNSELENVKIGNNVQTIGIAAFNNTKIKTIEIPDSVTTIGAAAFGGISALKSVTLGKGLQEYDSSVFSNSTNIETISLPFEEIPQNTFKNNTNIKKVIFNGTITIGTSAFEGTSIEELIIPDSVTTINNYAFKNITTLKKVSIGKNLESTAYYNIFASTNNITTLEIAQKTIPSGAFAGFTNLKYVTLTNNVEKLSAGSFVSTAIEKIEIPSSVTEIESGTFQSSNSLTKIINKTGRTFDWNGIIKGSNASDTAFETGTVTIGDRTVEITNN